MTSVWAEVPDSELEALWEELVLPRAIEERMLLVLRQGRLGKWFSGIGQEAVAVGVTHALEPQDVILPVHRNLGVFTGRGLDLDRLLRQLLGRADGYTAGRDRSFHFGDLEHGVVGMISHLAAMLPVADGLALAGQLRGTDRVVAGFVGDGATSEGDFHEACNLAAVWRLPVLFIVENNGWGLSTPVHEQYACEHLADRAVGYGMPGQLVDGNDVLAVVAAVRAAAARARVGHGPTLIELETFRMRGHEETSGTAYVPTELVEAWAGRDPILRLEAVLDQRGILPAEVRAVRRRALEAEVAQRVAAALTAPEPESTAEAEVAGVFAPPPVRSRAPGGSTGRELRYVDAISDALRQALRDEDRTLLLGQDIAEYGGAFKVTAGLVEEVGRARVRNTPIIESGAVGCALGLALDGFTPIVELQFGDFISCAFNQVVNNVATTHYRWGAPVGLVLRAPVGGGTGGGPFHSQDIEGWFGHVAGLKVVAPATPGDARGLLLAAVDDGNPVLYLEHKALYRTVSGAVDDGWTVTPIGRARVARAGRHVTVVTWSVGVHWALAAAARLSAEGIDVEVVDLRTLVPWDRDLVLRSVASTGRVLVLHEAPLTGGFGGEVAATIAEHAFADLDAPVRRLGALDTPVPFARALEALHSPQGRVDQALRELAAY